MKIMAPARSTSNSLKRAKDGSAFTRCEECKKKKLSTVRTDILPKKKPLHRDFTYVLGVVARDYSLSGTLRKERALYCEGEKKCDNLEKAAELDPTLNYLYMYRAACLMRKQSVEAALAEINRVLGFKLALECLELRFCFYLALEDYRATLCDAQAILTLSPEYRMFEGRVAATQL
ncbi:hypothetical protein IFM89_037678 [Coptis chinensis]|uniref:Uncharacterized protein n=1 Tax=Coptis chinensis TaxID=261450 RepID=A0A835IER9_9MAGN|nr:hypothetical protein IFM89_037678 [Coptis chinensis]